MERFRINERTMFGMFIILIGLVLFLNAVGIIDADISIGTFWPVILIGYGIIRIVNYDESTIFGIIILLIGVFFQLRNLDVGFLENVSLGSFFWPVIVILFGLHMIFPDKKMKGENGSPKVYRRGEEFKDDESTENNKY